MTSSPRSTQQGKGFFKDLLDSFFSGDRPVSPDDSSSNLLSTSRAVEESAVLAPSVLGEKVVHKLKGYFELAKEEIDKAVRAEEWGLADEAIGHYRNAQRVMLEAKAARVPDVLSVRDEHRIRNYQEKISKWQERVAERLQVLNERSAGSAAKKIAPSYTASTVSSTKKSSQNLVTHKSTAYHSPNVKSNHPTAGNMRKDGGSKHAHGNYDSQLVEMIDTTIVDRSPAIKWDDVAGLDKAKQTLLEMVILPTKRRDLFTGLRKPAKGLLLFGPPGNGKTMLAKAVASESEATFFNVSASSLTSKWVGEAEKLVRTLFMVAVERQPSIIFMDEIDSVLSNRVANENDASRRLKSEFLVQFDGVTSNSNDLVIVIGATNKPQELDDAVLRRLVKRIYVPLPDENVRRLLLRNQLKGRAFSLPSGDLERLVKLTEGYSGSDLQALCEEAAMMPIRELGPQNILNIKPSQVRPLKFEDFRKAMSVIRPSLNKSKWEELERWNKEFGSS